MNVGFKWANVAIALHFLVDYLPSTLGCNPSTFKPGTILCTMISRDSRNELGKPDILDFYVSMSKKFDHGMYRSTTMIDDIVPGDHADELAPGQVRIDWMAIVVLGLSFLHHYY